MPAREMSGVASPPISRPANVTLPRLGFHNPMMVRNVVVLPAPLRPSSTVMAPFGTEKSTPCRMWYWPIWVCTPCSVSSASAMGGPRGCGLRLGCDAEVGFLHHRRADHLGGLAVGHQSPVVQHDDAVGEALHHVHLVLDEQDGLVALALEPLDEV